MAVKKSLAQGPSSLSLDFKPRNKLKRQMLHVKRKRAKDSAHRARRFGIKKDEAKNPKLKEERLRKNIPLTLERKRVWDDADSDVEDALGVSVDVERIKRQKQEEEEELNRPLDSDSDASEVENDDDDDDDADSMLASSDDEDEKDKEDADNNRARGRKPSSIPSATERATSPSQSTRSTNLNLAPEALAAKFPSLFSPESQRPPKVLITTSLNSTLHHEAEILTNLFPNSVTSAALRMRIHTSSRSGRSPDSKKPAGLDIVHLPKGPMFHFSISNWVEGKKIPGHGNPTEHWPELILNNFRTPLGLLTAHLFRTLFPPQPDIQGRQVVTLHNQRDYIFVRRHRYVFREKRETEKSVVGTDGKEIKGAEWIRTGLQELGPRFTLKLRRVDKGIQRASGQEWEWKGGMEKQRTKFQL
ncbi:hypothetical protein AOCH_001815 [Aspergillus ochraceoroseus]|uniref:Brix domain-containing protein n=1 Tax=Aspergillus ochraceoroseus TaxID=138278 RepID=A0A0F8WPZ2_9EURO|nr:hypothetical protein AOCH_001815 [Aspergillus ochraceoroseus]